MLSADDQKSLSNMDNASTLRKSPTPSLNEKAVATGSISSREGSSSPTPSTTKNGVHEQHNALEKVTTTRSIKSVAEAQKDLDRIMTSGEGVEYPTGAKLALISLALCLSVSGNEYLSLSVLY